MGKYVFAYRGGPGVTVEEGESEAVMAAWGAWFGTMGGALVDGGNPFAASTSVTAGGGSGEASSALSGYSIVTAASLDDARTLALGCPLLTSGGCVDIYEALDM